MDRRNPTPQRPVARLALVAHDGKKEELMETLRAFLPILGRCSLVATHGTGSLCIQRLRLPIRLLKSGPRGGDQQVGAMVAEGKLDAVIFLRDPLTAQPHEPDISALLRVCDVHNVPVATNSATARAVLASLNTYHQDAELQHSTAEPSPGGLADLVASGVGG